MTEIKLVRIYDHEQPGGYRILVDRMWPRGISKVKWFNHEDEKFPEFKAKYINELDDNNFTTEFIKIVRNKLKSDDVLFLYGAKNREHNQAVVLKKYVENHL